MSVRPSDPLAAALNDHRRYVLADDLERERAIESSGCEELRTLAAAVQPLYDEINTLLDQLTGAPHPLPGDLEALEVDLNSLAQAADEAAIEAAQRCC